MKDLSVWLPFSSFLSSFKIVPVPCLHWPQSSLIIYPHHLFIKLLPPCSHHNSASLKLSLPCLTPYSRLSQITLPFTRFSDSCFLCRLLFLLRLKLHYVSPMNLLCLSVFLKRKRNIFFCFFCWMNTCFGLGADICAFPDSICVMRCHWVFLSAVELTHQILSHIAGGLFSSEISFDCFSF